MKMLVFQSPLFTPYLPDDSQVNPNVLGFELAHWLSVELAKAGTITSYPHAEDWGWFLDFEEGGIEYMICCSGSGEDDGAFEWRVYVEAPKKLFRKASPGPASGTLLEGIRAVLTRAGIVVEDDADADDQS